MAAQTTNISSDLVWQLTRMLYLFLFFFFSKRKPYSWHYLKIEEKAQLDRLPTFQSTRHHFLFFFIFAKYIEVIEPRLIQCFLNRQPELLPCQGQGWWSPSALP